MLVDAVPVSVAHYLNVKQRRLISLTREYRRTYDRVKCTLEMCDYLYYIKIGLSRCVRTGVAWMDGRSDDVRRPATGAGEGRGAARCVAYERAGTSPTVVIYNTA